jgi:hypothetical protein
MTVLRKDFKTTVIPGNPGVPTVLGRPEVPGYYKTTTTGRWIYGYTTSYNFATGQRLCNSPIDPYEVSRTPCYYSEGVSVTDVTLRFPVVSPNAVYSEETTTEYVPATPAIQGTEGVSPTRTQIVRSRNEGWRSWSRSIDSLEAGNFLAYSVATGVRGVMIGIGSLSDVLTRSITAFRHGIIVDKTGVKVYESGGVVTTLDTHYQAVSEIRINRRTDNQIVYLLITGTDNYIHVSGTDLEFAGLTLYASAQMYSGGDQITSSTMRTGNVQFGSA